MLESACMRAFNDGVAKPLQNKKNSTFDQLSKLAERRCLVPSAGAHL